MSLIHCKFCLNKDYIVHCSCCYLLWVGVIGTTGTHLCRHTVLLHSHTHSTLALSQYKMMACWPLQKWRYALLNELLCLSQDLFIINLFCSKAYFVCTYIPQLLYQFLIFKINSGGNCEQLRKLLCDLSQTSSWTINGGTFSYIVIFWGGIISVDYIQLPSSLPITVVGCSGIHLPDCMLIIFRFEIAHWWCISAEVSPCSEIWLWPCVQPADQLLHNPRK